MIVTSRPTRTYSTALATALIAVLAASACASKSTGSSSGSGSSGAPDTSAKKVSIAVGAPLSGNNGRAGQEQLHAVSIAVDEFNAAGGLDGVQVGVEQGDDQGDPANGQAVAQKFCDNSAVLAVVGHYNSGVTISASDVYQKCGLSEVSPLSSNPKVTERGLPNVFRIGARDDYMGPAVAAYLATKTQLKKISTIDDQSAYGVGIVKEFSQTAAKRGLKIEKSAAIKAGDKDFRAVLGTLPKDTEVIYFGGYPADAALLAKQASEVGLKAIIAGGDGLYDPDFLKGGQAVDKAVLASSAGKPNDQNFITAYKAKFGEPSGYGLQEYNTARLVLQALKSAKDKTRPAVMEALHGITYSPTDGGDPVVFDTKGDNKNAQVHIFVVKSGDFSEVDVIKPADFK